MSILLLVLAKKKKKIKSQFNIVLISLEKGTKIFIDILNPKYL